MLSARASGFSESETMITLCDRRDGIVTLINSLVILHDDWSSGSRDSSVELHWSFIHSLSQRVTDRYRRLTSALTEGSLVICHCLCSRLFRRISSSMPGGIGGHGSSLGRLLVVDVPEPSERTPKSYQRNCLLSSRSISSRTQLFLPSEFGNWPRLCA